MGKLFVWFFIFVFISSVCLAANEWGDMNDGNINTEESHLVEENFSENNEMNPVIVDKPVSDNGNGKFYTINFYIAISLAFFLLIIFIIILWLWIRGTKNKWE